MTEHSANVITDYGSLNAFLNLLFLPEPAGTPPYYLTDNLNDPAVRINSIYELVVQDMLALGYNVEFADYVDQNFSSYVAPSAVPGKRLIALVNQLSFLYANWFAMVA